MIIIEMTPTEDLDGNLYWIYNCRGFFKVSFSCMSWIMEIHCTMFRFIDNARVCKNFIMQRFFLFCHLQTKKQWRWRFLLHWLGGRGRWGNKYGCKLNATIATNTLAQRHGEATTWRSRISTQNCRQHSSRTFNVFRIEFEWTGDICQIRCNDVGKQYSDSQLCMVTNKPRKLI